MKSIKIICMLITSIILIYILTRSTIPNLHMNKAWGGGVRWPQGMVCLHYRPYLHAYYLRCFHLNVVTSLYRVWHQDVAPFTWLIWAAGWNGLSECCTRTSHSAYLHCDCTARRSDFILTRFHPLPGRIISVSCSEKWEMTSVDICSLWRPILLYAASKLPVHMGVIRLRSDSAVL
jgi:hypothetical protein